LLLIPVVAHAQWVLNGAMLTTDAGIKSSVHCAPDGMGGTLLTWTRNYADPGDIYVQRLDAGGTPMWTANGVVVCNEPGAQLYPVVVSDGAGGAIVAWTDQRPSGTIDIYVRRVNASGVAQWTANGVALSAATSIQDRPRIVSDQAGGAIVVWKDFRAGNDDVYARRVNASGVPQWTANGVAVVTQGALQEDHAIVSDGAGGVIVVWADYRYGGGDVDIFAQRINSAGGVQWVLDGVSVCGSFDSQFDPTIVSDGNGGAIFSWSDFRNGFNFDIYAQRFNAAGVFQWSINGIVLCDESDNQNDVVMASDGAGGAVVAWQDHRGALAVSNLYAQRVTASSATLWYPDGVLLCDAFDWQFLRGMTPDGMGGVVVTWEDYRSLSSTSVDLYAQRLDKDGGAQWTSNGLAVCTHPGVPQDIGCAGDGAGGTVFSWIETTFSPYQVFAQRVEDVYGVWGRPEPRVDSVADIPNDQGGKVAVNWSASGRDRPNPRTIEFYSVWRAVDAIPVDASVISSAQLSTLAKEVAGPVYLGTPGHYFERIGTQSAHGWPAYSFAASTRADSVASDAGDEVFMVAAHDINDDYVAFASNEVSGHSVDNLAPLAPFLLIAQRVGTDVHLNWNRAVAPDLRDYAVYRATASGVTPVPINFLASAEDTLAVDPNAPSSALYYIVTAYDVHANQSAPSNEASVGALTGVGNTPAITALTVRQNHPNPFSATTDLEIGLPKVSDVTVEVFDVAGRRVSMMELAGVKGWQRVRFAGRDERGRPLASGVYFARVSAAGATITRKMVIAR
jgi:hypothetical protein